MKGERLGEFEEVVMLSVGVGGDDASGVAIQETLEEEANRQVTLGAIYAALDRLARKGFVTSRLGDPTPTRGGRRKRYYKLTASGLKALAEMRSVRDSMWKKAGITLNQRAAK